MNKFYALPLNSVIIMMVFAILVWAKLEQVANKNKKFEKWWRCVNIILCICSVFLIIRMTLLGRVSEQRVVELMPFHTFTTMSYNKEASRTLLMNLVLFLPLGLALPYIFKCAKNDRQRWMYCFVTGCCISISVEVLQYCWALGLAETDDVICNSLGCALGIMANVLGREFK